MDRRDTGDANNRGGPSARRILAAGLLAAFIDGLFALGLQRAYTGGFAPARIFRGIASGLLGEAAFEPGVVPVVLGVLLHTSFACIWATVFGLAYRRFDALRAFTRPVGGAIAVAFVYGAVVWPTMNYVAKSIGGIEPTSASTNFFWVMLIGHGVFVGLPIVLVIRGGTRARPGR